MESALLEVDQLYVTFQTDDGPIYAVNGLSYTLHRSQTLGIVGESGSGKSVSSQAVMGLLPRRETQIGAQTKMIYKGRTLHDMAERDLALLRGNSMGMIFQDPLTSLNPYRRIGMQMIEGVRHHQGLGRTEALQRAEAMLEFVHVPDAKARLRSYPHELSGGLRQRVLIAQTLMTDPELIFADEPTTALDVTVQAQIMRLLRQMRREKQTAIVLISHDLELVAQECDHIVVMYGGTVMEAGSPEVIFTKPMHPYTIALKSSIPSLEGPKKQRLSAIPGQPPHPGQPSQGCPFRMRCPQASKECQEQIPLQSLAENHTIRCIKV